MTTRIPFDTAEIADLDSGLTEELAEHSANLAWGLFIVAAILCVFLAWNAISVNDENQDLREQLVAARMELDAKRAYDDSWTCTYDRRDPRSAKGIIRSCIRTVESF